MKKFLQLSSWLMIAAVAWGVGYLYNARYGGELSWLRIMYEQKKAIASEVKSPKRILIVGGSGAHYTVDAGLMQQQLGIPTINMATDGPVGLDVILASMDDVIRKGDIVVLIPEYLILLEDDGLGDRSGQFGVAIGKPGLGGVPAKQLAQDIMLLGVPTLRAVTKSSVEFAQKGRLTGYYSDPITANGDPTVMKQRLKTPWWQLKIKAPVSRHALRSIKEFKEQVEAKGGTLVLGLSWIYASTDSKTLDNISKTAEKLGEIAPVLYDKQTLNVKTDSSLFADTHYHLNPPGRRTRTTELVEQFRALNLKE
ncbi:hypothetical protein [Nostoc sp. TCL26-01]|uniref:hypothetical protein n=1 Tax=Nostoc sp. TCL26-01 TaxID=2576904 RepID=UPI0015BAFA71|nr:hypothetical protein [Nostoc sp. TCL26-01]QLE56270.1 hypothetical protein FD725_12390 [Nostoc sp. TCL26-01]